MNKQAKYYKFNYCLSKSTSKSSSEINTNLLVSGPILPEFPLINFFPSFKANTPFGKYISCTLTFRELEPAGTSFLVCILIFSLSRDHSAADKYVLMSPILKTKQNLCPHDQLQLSFLGKKAKYFWKELSVAIISLPTLTPHTHLPEKANSNVSLLKTMRKEILSVRYCIPSTQNGSYHIPKSVNIY